MSNNINFFTTSLCNNNQFFTQT